MEGQVIYFEGHIAATVTPVGIAFSHWVGELGQDDPTWRFLSAAAACAYDVLTGCLKGPYSKDLAVAYARGVAVGAGDLYPRGPADLVPTYPAAMLRRS